MFSYVTCSQKFFHCSHQNVFLCSLFPNVFALLPSKCFLMFPVPKCLCTVPLKMFSNVHCSQMSLYCSPYVPCSQMSLHCSPQNVFLCSLFPNVFALFPSKCFLMFTVPKCPCTVPSKYIFFRGTVQRHLGTGNIRKHFVTRQNFGLSSLLLKLNVLVSLSPEALWRASPVSGI